MNRCIRFLLALLLSINCYLATAHEGHTSYQAGHVAVSLVADQHGKLWRASVNKGHVYVDYSTDMGKRFSKPVQVNADKMKIAAHGEARPKIALAGNGNIYLTWTQPLKKRFTGYIWFARSVDGGKSFEKPYIVHQDKAVITHRFDALHASSNGNVTVVWIDKRDLEAAKKADKPYRGAAIYYAVSTNQGKSFNPEQKLTDHSCECCRIAVTSKPDGTVVAMWRHVFEGSQRDHAMAEIPKAGEAPNIVRASYGRWELDGCPHHGGALAYGKDFGYHMAYFDGGGKKPGLKYSRMDGEAWVAFPPKKFGNNKKRAGHPALYSQGDNVWLAWRESGEKSSTEIWGMHSTDGGKSWSEPTLKTTIHGKADYPQIIANQGKVYLMVNQDKKGLKVLELQ